MRPLLALLLLASLSACPRNAQAPPADQAARLVTENRAKAQHVAMTCDPTQPDCQALKVALLGQATADDSTHSKSFSLASDMPLGGAQ